MIDSGAVGRTFDGYLVEGWGHRFLCLEERCVAGGHRLGMMDEIGWQEDLLRDSAVSAAVDLEEVLDFAVRFQSKERMTDEPGRFIASDNGKNWFEKDLDTACAQFRAQRSILRATDLASQDIYCDIHS
jgi:hypothetical protein